MSKPPSTYNPYDPAIDLEAQHRFDAEHAIAKDRDLYDLCRSRIPSSAARLTTAVMGPLTDRAITRYAAAGYYSSNFQAARRELMNRRNRKRNHQRDGNFIIHDNGSKTYSPL